MTLALNASAPAIVKATGSGAAPGTATTAAFSPPANAFLIAMVAANNDTAGGDSTLQSVTNTGTAFGGWTRRVLKNNSAGSTGGAGVDGGAEIWTATTGGSAPGSITVAALMGAGQTGTGAEINLKVMVITDSGGTAPTLGNVAAGAGTAGLPSTTVTASAGSYVLSVSSDWATVAAPDTYGAGITSIVDNRDAIYCWHFSRTTNTTSAGSQTMNMTATSGQTWDQAILETKAPISAAPAFPFRVGGQRRTYLPKQFDWARGTIYSAVPPQVPVPVKVADQTSQAARRRQFMLVRSGKTFTPVPAQVLPVPPRPPDQPTQRRAQRGWSRLKGRYVDPPWTPPQAPVNPAIVLNPSQRRVLRGWPQGRGKASQVVPPQVPVPPRKPDDLTQRRAQRSWLRVKGRYLDPPWGQQAPPVNPPIVLNPSQRRVLRGWPQGRGKRVTPVPPQIPTPPRKPDDPTQRRSLRGWLRVRPRQWAPPWPQAVQPPSQDVVLKVGQTVGRWFAGVTVGRWAAGSTVSRWQAGETVSAWKVISQGATMSQTIASASLQYVRAPVAATVNGAAFNPTVDTVQMAFTSTFREPVLADFNAGSWETAGSTYYARCLVGPGGAVALTAGVWFVWVKVTDAPEIPVLPAGTLTVTP